MYIYESQCILTKNALISFVDMRKHTSVYDMTSCALTVTKKVENSRSKVYNHVYVFPLYIFKPKHW